MHISVTRKKYQKVKELGNINMCIGSIAFYQLMQVCQVSASMFMTLEAFPSFFLAFVDEPH